MLIFKARTSSGCATHMDFTPGISSSHLHSLQSGVRKHLSFVFARFHFQNARLFFQTSGQMDPNSSPSPSTISLEIFGVPNLPYFSPEAHLAFLQFRTEAFHGLKKGRFRQQKFWMFPIVILISPGSLKLPLKIYHPKRRGLSSKHHFSGASC